VLAGGLALELNLRYRREVVELRKLNDIDFLVDSFAEIPESLGREFLLRHIHPDDPPAKTLLQAVDPETRVRIDVFRAYGAEMARAVPQEGLAWPRRVVSVEDQAARAARLVWGLAVGTEVAPKFARDFLRLASAIGEEEMDAVWKEHRKAGSLERFAETVERLRGLIGFFGARFGDYFALEAFGKAIDQDAVEAGKLTDAGGGFVHNGGHRLAGMEAGSQPRDHFVEIQKPRVDGERCWLKFEEREAIVTMDKPVQAASIVFAPHLKLDRVILPRVDGQERVTHAFDLIGREKDGEARFEDTTG
jgi:hypothetical protein